MRIKAGKLRHRITVYTRTGTLNASLSPIGNESAALTDLPASVRPLTAREKFRGDGVRTELTHLVEVRYNSAIVAAAEIVFEGRRFMVTGVMDPDERKHKLLIECQEVQA